MKSFTPWNPAFLQISGVWVGFATNFVVYLLNVVELRGFPGLSKRGFCRRSNRIFRVPIPSEKNRNVGVIPFLGHTWILRVRWFFYGLYHGIYHHFSPPFGRIFLLICSKHFFSKFQVLRVWRLAWKGVISTILPLDTPKRETTTFFWVKILPRWPSWCFLCVTLQGTITYPKRKGISSTQIYFGRGICWSPGGYYNPP